MEQSEELSLSFLKIHILEYINITNLYFLSAICKL